VVFTERQTAGRGQKQRPWYSPDGVLTASFLLDALPWQKLPKLSLGVALGVIQTVEELLPSLSGQLKIKWPNDVFLDDGKLAGILCENTPRLVVVGVGLNLGVDWDTAGLTPTQIGKACSLKEITPGIPETLLWLTQLRKQIRKVPESLDEAIFWQQWHARDLLYQRSLTLKQRESLYQGYSQGIDGEGRLLIKLATGEVKAFAAGTIIGWQ
jgi:BirA family biotin operon repressor/biotin-[acetyl-CoA-carboxylase] ligase